jgi:anaerobic selenocysteine-containing dehydrogenase
MNPRDAKPRGIADGDIIRFFNIRGASLAAVHVTDAIAPASSSSRPAPGTTRWTPRTRHRSASTAIRTC